MIVDDYQNLTQLDECLDEDCSSPNMYCTDHEISCHIKKKSNDEMSISHVNIRSLPRNFDSLINYVSLLNVTLDIIALSETKITDKINSTVDINIPNYTFINIKSLSYFGGVRFLSINQLIIQ